MLEFSNDNLSPTFHILVDLNTTSYFELSKFFDYEIKSRKCAKIRIMKNFTSLIFLLLTLLNPRRKGC